MRFAKYEDNVVDALAEKPPRDAECILCGCPVVLRGGELGLLSLLTAGSQSHYAHTGKACGWSVKHDKLILAELNELLREEQKNNE